MRSTTFIGRACRCRRAFKTRTLCGGHPLGTDEVGRDLLSRLLFGARISLTVGLFAVIMEVLIGTMLGAIAGYYGGWLDYALMRVTDVFLSIPLLPLLLVLTAIVAASSSKAALSFGVIVVIIGALSWPPVARLVRASFLSLREREFAEAARALGNNDGRIIFRHLLPNAVAPIVVQATLDVANVIILESTLSFLGLRHPAADGVVGQHAGERARQSSDRLVGRRLSRPLHSDHRPRDQLHRRRPARRSRPEHALSPAKIDRRPAAGRAHPGALPNPPSRKVAPCASGGIGRRTSLRG